MGRNHYNVIVMELWNLESRDFVVTVLRKDFWELGLLDVSYLYCINISYDSLLGAQYELRDHINWRSLVRPNPMVLW